MYSISFFVFILETEEARSGKFNRRKWGRRKQ